MKRTKHESPWTARAIRWTLRQLGFAYFRMQIGGLEHVPAKGPAIVAGNHPNVLDGILLLIVSPRPIRFLVVEQLYFHPLMHWAFKATNCIPVYRSRDNNGDALRAAVEALEKGQVIGIFPEGTTDDLGQMKAIKRGVGLLALRTGAPVVPFGIWGTDIAYPKGRRIPTPMPVSMVFNKPVYLSKEDAYPVAEDLLGQTLERLRLAILQARSDTFAYHVSQMRPWLLKRLQVALSAFIVWPLAWVLTVTAPPEPAKSA